MTPAVESERESEREKERERKRERKRERARERERERARERERERKRERERESERERETKGGIEMQQQRHQRGLSSTTRKVVRGEGASGRERGMHPGERA